MTACGDKAGTKSSMIAKLGQYSGVYQHVKDSATYFGADCRLKGPKDDANRK